jgi:hypothetical protein
MTTHNAHRSVAAPPARPPAPPAPPAPPWDAMFATGPQPSHRPPVGRFEALPQVVQLTATGEGTQVVVVALTIGGSIWACRPFSGDPAWQPLPNLPESASGAPEGL